MSEEKSSDILKNMSYVAVPIAIGRDVAGLKHFASMKNISRLTFGSDDM